MSDETLSSKYGRLTAGAVRHIEQAMIAGGARGDQAEDGSHFDRHGNWQSDRFPTVPRRLAPLSIDDPLAQDLLWKYADRHAAANKHGDSQFAEDLKRALRQAGYDGERIQEPVIVPDILWDLQNPEVPLLWRGRAEPEMDDTARGSFPSRIDADAPRPEPQEITFMAALALPNWIVRFTPVYDDGGQLDDVQWELIGPAEPAPSQAAGEDTAGDGS